VQALEDPCLLPVAQAAPAGHAGAESELLRQPRPGDSGREYEQDAPQHEAIFKPPATRNSGSAAFVVAGVAGLVPRVRRRPRLPALRTSDPLLFLRIFSD
jgi:hypothetical protein